VSNNLPSSSPPPDETPGAQFEDLEHDLQTIPQAEHASQPQRNRVTIEDVTEEEASQQSGHYFEEYPTERKAGAALNGVLSRTRMNGS